MESAPLNALATIGMSMRQTGVICPVTLTWSQLMHKGFKENNPEINCSCEIYCSIIWDMNINFGKLGKEGCETCDQFHQIRTHMDMK